MRAANLKILGMKSQTRASGYRGARMMKCKLCSQSFNARARRSSVKVHQNSGGLSSNNPIVKARDQVTPEDFCSTICFERKRVGWNQAFCDNCRDVLTGKVRQSEEGW